MWIGRLSSDHISKGVLEFFQVLSASELSEGTAGQDRIEFRRTLSDNPLDIGLKNRHAQAL